MVVEEIDPIPARGEEMTMDSLGQNLETRVEEKARDTRVTIVLMARAVVKAAMTGRAKA